MQGKSCFKVTASSTVQPSGQWQFVVMLWGVFEHFYNLTLPHCLSLNGFFLVVVGDGKSERDQPCFVLIF